MNYKKFRHKKSLGQHFLIDKNIVKKIVKIADIQAAENVWEIGAGKGILTEELVNADSKLTVFEVDKTLFPHLEEKFGDKITLVKQDVLKANWQKLLEGRKIKIVANLPYQITSPFLFRVASFSENISLVVVMIQKEVAQRINAKTGSKDYGILSLKMQFYFDVSYQFTVKPHLFFPQPKVESAVISMMPRKNKPEIKDEKLFWKIVETAFRNRRKMLRNNLKTILSSDLIEKIAESFDLTRRGETFSESEFLDLYHKIVSLLP
ncbi:MAG: ribosomal RNA small subunit methyltransferase A [Candidatus Cloacimonas sp. 4484_275]|nr:MAG: ribosomal RNA small subunit methyltransferase A [Candidatus Cloacimonas sp. 4484_275]